MEEIYKKIIEILSWFASGAVIGFTIKGIGGYILKLLGKNHKKEKEMSSRQEIEKEIEKEMENKYKTKYELESLSKITDALKNQFDSLMNDINSLVKREITQLKNDLEGKYASKENFDLMIQLIGKISSELATYKNRTYPVIETSKRDLVDRKVEIVSNDVYNNNSEIQFLLESITKNK